MQESSKSKKPPLEKSDLISQDIKKSFKSNIEIYEKDRVLKVSNAFFEEIPIIDKYKSYESDVYKLLFLSSGFEKILKIDRIPSIVRSEQNVIRQMAQYIKELPEIILSQKDFKGEIFDFSIMNSYESLSFSELHKASSSECQKLFFNIGCFIASLSIIPLNEKNSFNSIEVLKINNYCDLIHNKLYEWELLSGEFKNILIQVRNIVENSSIVFGHNSLQIVTKKNFGFYAIDWNQAGASFPYYDLSNYIHRLKSWEWADIISTNFENDIIAGFKTKSKISSFDFDQYKIWESFQYLRDVIWHLSSLDYSKIKTLLKLASFS